MDLTSIRNTAEQLRTEIHKVVVGQDRAIELMLISLLSEGHILLEGVPGVAKTLLARSFAACLSLDFNRIQFTPDLMPGDVIGTNLFNFQTNEFVLTKGPIFTKPGQMTETVIPSSCSAPRSASPQTRTAALLSP